MKRTGSTPEEKQFDAMLKRTYRDRWKTLPAQASDIVYIMIGTLLLILLSALARPAHSATPYYPGGPAVRVYDGGTGAHDAATARRNLGITSATIPGFRDSLSTLSYVALLNPLIHVLDNQLWIKDDGDTTKRFQFQASGISTGTLRTFTVPNANGTLPLLEANNVWSGTNAWGANSTFNGTTTVRGGGSVFEILNNAGTGGTRLTSLAGAVDRTNSFPSAEGQVLIENATQNVGGKTLFTSNTIIARDDRFSIGDDADTTKIFVFNAANAPTGTTRTLALPDTNGTLASLAKTQTFTRAQTIAPTADFAGLQIAMPSGAVDNAFAITATDVGGIVSAVNAQGGNFAPFFALTDAPFTGASASVVIQPKSAVSVSRAYKVDNSIATNAEFLMTTGTQTSSGAKTFSGATVFTGAAAANVDGTVSHWRLRDQADNTKQVAANLSQITASTTRVDTIPDYSGQRVVRINERDFVSQTANIGSTTIASPSAGMYRVTVYGVTNAIMTGAVVVTIGWTDPVQAQTKNAATIGTGVGGEDAGEAICRIASGNITLSTSGYLTGTFSVYSRVEAIP